LYFLDIFGHFFSNGLEFLCEIVYTYLDNIGVHTGFTEFNCRKVS